ncbi:uncharacterized protein LOC113338526 [Papaver somniferum]|uniref:uncharacterized protein LOC113338526 n=1 Tax=Papaver somniferum TaxID=3469 RepID=UPI000E6F87E2|nr:uncharacterized protein LOC113338526 [Papaver somniferum]
MQLENEEGWEFDRFLWKKNIPPKVSFMLWAIFHESLPTYNMLIRRDVEVQSEVCVMCKMENETADHLLVNCSYAYEVWSYFLNAFKVSLVAPNTVKAFFESWRMNSLSGRCKEIWWKIIYAVMWHLWKERGKGASGGREKTAEELIMLVKQTIMLWLINSDVFRGYDVNQILFNWISLLHM